MTQYYRLTLQEAREQYQAGLMNASGLFYCYLKIRMAPDWKITLHQQAICQELGISKASFYRALAKLEEQKLIHSEVPSGILVSWRKPDETTSDAANDDTSRDGSRTVPTTDTPILTAQVINVTIVDTPVRDIADVQVNNSDAATSDVPISPVRPESRDRDNSLNSETQSLNPEIFSLNSETQSLKRETPTALQPAQNKASSDTSNSYQIFISSLSEGEREKFLAFCEEQTRNLPRPVIDMACYLAALDASGQPRFRDFHRRFLASAAGRAAKQEAIATQHNWESDPHFDDWLKRAFYDGMAWVQENEAEREQRYAFFEWAQTTDAYKGRLY